MQDKTTVMSITRILRRTLISTIEMLQDVVEQCSDDMWEISGKNAPIWEQVYHATFWLNAWARDWSTPFEKPPFHSDQALELEHGDSPVITRREMRDYLGKVKGECLSFLDALTDDALVVGQEAFGHTLTPADRILGQIQHVQHHIGIIHAQMREATGAYPKWRE